MCLTGAINKALAAPSVTENLKFACEIESPESSHSSQRNEMS